MRNRAVGVVTAEKNTPKYSENFAANNYRYSICRLVIICDRAPIGCPTIAEIQAEDNELEMKGLFDNAALFSRRPPSQLTALDFALFKNWFSHCTRFHGDKCQPEGIELGHADKYFSTFRVIDTSRNCVVDAKPDWRYIALSYVWGRASMLMLFQSNKTKLYQDGSLVKDKSIPKTICDAIQVARQLGERYIWVDALCIMQDDLMEKERVIGEMNLVYSRAVLTLVAASGTHADTGLPGLSAGPRNSNGYDASISLRVTKGGRTVSVGRTRASEIITSSKWNIRGWTYQERLFSHRMLLFTDEQTFYWCGKSLWCEDTVLETDSENVHFDETPLHRFNILNDPSLPFMKQFQDSDSISVFEEYTRIVEEYSRREFSFQGDVIHAFAGLQSRLKTSYSSSQDTLILQFGLPSEWFELSLNWQHHPDSTTFCRRHAYHTRNGVKTPFPSWSWTGWEGQIMYVYPQAAQCRTRPEIRWYCFDPNGKLINLVSLDVSSHPLPPWFNSSDAPRPLRDIWKPSGARTVVQEAQIVDYMSPAGPTLRLNLLIFYTSSALLPITERKRSLFPAVVRNITEFYIGGDAGNKEAGRIMLDSDWVVSHPAPSYEFIVISRTVEDDWRDPGMLDTLNIMLIEWQDNIAYRVAVGAIDESTWVAFSPQWKLVCLG